MPLSPEIARISEDKIRGCHIDYLNNVDVDPHWD